MASKQLKITIIGDSSSAQRAIRGIASEADHVGGALSKFGGFAAKSLLAVGAGAAGALGWGVKIAAEAETASVGFETMLGSAEAAQGFMKDLQSFAAKTPFEFPELRNAAGRFIAVGVEASRVIPIMSAVGDATSAMGTGSVGIDRATTALTQMAQKGKVTAEEMMQLTEAGIPAWDALAAKLGVDIPTAMDMVSKGTVHAGDMFEALEQRAGPAMQRVAGMMDKQSQTLAGMFSTLKDTVGQSLATLAQPLVKGLSNLMPRVQPFIEKLAGAFAPILEQAVPILGSLLDAVAPVVEVLGVTFAQTLQNLMPALQPLIAALGDGLLQVVKEIAPVLPQLATSLADLLIEITPLIPVATQLAMVFAGSVVGAMKTVTAITNNLLVPAFRWIVAVVETVASGISIAWGTIKNFLTATWGAIRSTAASIWAGIKASIIGPINEAKNSLVSAFNSARDQLLGAWNAIKSGIASAVSFVAGKFDWLRDKIAGIAAKIRSIIGGLPFVPGSPIPLVVWTGMAVDQTLSKFDQLAQGIQVPLRAVTNSVSPVGDALTRTATAPPMAAGSAPAGGGSVTYVNYYVDVHVEGSVRAAEDLATQVESILSRKQQRGNVGRAL